MRMMKRRFRLSEENKKQIEAAVSEAESKTSGEIVPMIVPSSHDYWWVHWFWAGAGWLIATILLWVFTHNSPWALGVFQISLWQLLGVALGFATGYCSFLKRHVIPKAWADSHVHRQAMANFMAAGLHQTRDRTGILIFVSQLERRVEILADIGIDQKTEQGFWHEQVTHIIEGIHQGELMKSLVKAIKNIGIKLAENFPPRDDDTDEVSNQVRLEHHRRDEKDES